MNLDFMFDEETKQLTEEGKAVVTAVAEAVAGQVVQVSDKGSTRKIIAALLVAALVQGAALFNWKQHVDASISGAWTTSAQKDWAWRTERENTNGWHSATVVSPRQQGGID